MTSADGLSFLQLEEELRAAEAYLSTAQRPEQHGQPVHPQQSAIDNHSLFSRKPKTRPVLSDERRREILSKLSAERQATMRKRQLPPSHQSADSTPDAMAPAQNNRYSTQEERSQLLQKLFSARSMSVEEEEHATPPSSMLPVYHFDASPDEHALPSPDRGDWASDEDQDELFYASDIVNGNGVHTGYESNGEDEDTGLNPQQTTGASIFSRLLARPHKDEESSYRPRQDAFGLQEPDFDREEIQEEKMEAISMLEDSEEGDPRFSEADYIDEYASDGGQDAKIHRGSEYQSTLRPANTTNPVVSKRIEYLARPRTHAFAEREKQRLMREMESFKECTFQPNTQKPPVATRKKSQPNTSSSRPGTMAFPWLSLSPRRKSFSDRPRYSESALTPQEKTQNTIQRLHLDGTTRYELREQAKMRLEQERLEADCTFQPKINETSKRLANMVDYKPIHERVSQLQRAKTEHMDRIREQVDYDEGLTTSFTPNINPTSRAIAETLLATKQGEHYTTDDGLPVKPQTVTDRLAEDAESLLEKRAAIQEYYDALEEQPFAPTINEQTLRIVQRKPEFQMDFVSRQQYFQSREQQKLESLEDANEGGQQKLFTPDIGNANDVLKQLRPDQLVENNSQKLYRLTYNDARALELKKQQLREEAYSKYTFKPEINPISRALARSTSIDALAEPHSNVDAAALRLPQQRDPNSRRSLQEYFANKRYRSRVAQEMDQAEKAECTFQPTLIASASKSTPKDRARAKSIWKSEHLLDHIEAERQRKAQALEAKRNEQELKELQECTFQPNLGKNGGSKPRKSPAKGSPSPPPQRGTSKTQPAPEERSRPVIVRGLGRFLELRELAKKQQQEQKQREEKVFCLQKSYNETRNYTVPKPFALSESSKDSIRRRLRVREEMRAKERQECTFTPLTMESRNRKVLENLLQER